MSDNPYAAPQAASPIVGIKSGTREDLRKVATCQRGVLGCILAYIIGVIIHSVVLLELRLYVFLAIIAVSLVGLGFVIILAIRVYSLPLGILLGILMFIPCISLLVLLVVNQKATSILKQNGIRVGLLGANKSDI